MREILFRGKSKAQGSEWLYGDVLIYENSAQIWETINNRKHNSVVSLETVGQSTGLTDKNGKKIFEGDVVKVEGFIEPSFIVIYYNGGFKLKEIGSPELFAYYITETMVEEELIEAIGNIHDNPELLKGGEG